MARIAVIGAGMGAMAAAARLAVAGHRVTVYERSGTYGGAVGRFERDGFVFDTGPGLLHLPAVWRDVFVKTGREPLEKCVELVQVDPAARHLFADGSTVTLPNASRAGVVDALDAALGGGAGERWGAYLDRARATWDRTRRPLLEEPLPADVSPLERDPYPALKSGLLRRTARTVEDVGLRELRDPRLAALLGSYARLYGFDPHTAPASAAVLPYMEQTFGSWYVRGGMRELARAVYERCLARKVEFVFDAEVAGVREKEGRACGLELADGQEVEADQVVAGVPLPSAGWPRGEQGAGALVVFLALSGGRPTDTVHRTVVHGDGDALPVVTVERPDDPAAVPDSGHEAVRLTAPGAGAGQLDQVLAAAETAVPGLRSRLLWQETSVAGAARGPALAGAGGAFLAAANRSELPGLYRAGGWSHPGGGLAHAGMSGALVAGLIVEGDAFRGSQ
ncbi:NAD(P)/FAD-dependent oxidoreductase [Streptomyces sp. NPDC050738]|uniref:phytoene desaturase family protein n=1 Tax=Streptomyces sp. NPDC050738 TaxID=3154744 RepID=UPI00343959D5